MFERLRASVLRLNPYGYGYVAGGGSVFPREHGYLVEVRTATPLNGALFNAWDPIVLEEDVILGHEVMFLRGRHEVRVWTVVDLELWRRHHRWQGGMDRESGDDPRRRDHW